MVHHHMIKKVKKVTKEKIKYKRISDSPTSHKSRRNKSHKKDHKKKHGSSSSSGSDFSSCDDRLLKPSNKRRKKHKSKYDLDTVDLLKVYERDAEIIQPLANFIDDRAKLAEEVLNSVNIEYVCGLFPDLKNSTLKEVTKFLSEMLKYMSRDRILALLNGTEISSSSATSVDGYEDDDFATTSQYSSPSRTNVNNKRTQLLTGSGQSDVKPNYLFVTHSETVQSEITTYGIVDVNGDVIPTVKEAKKKVELEEGEVNSDEASCENNDECDAFEESVAYVRLTGAAESRTVTIQGDGDVYSVTDDDEDIEVKSAHSHDNSKRAVGTPRSSGESEEEGVIESSSDDDVLDRQSDGIENSPSAAVNISDDETTSKPHQVCAVSSTSRFKPTVELDEGEIEEDEDEDSLQQNNQNKCELHDVGAEEEADEYFDFELVE